MSDEKNIDEIKGFIELEVNRAISNETAAFRDHIERMHKILGVSASIIVAMMSFAAFFFFGDSIDDLTRKIDDQISSEMITLKITGRTENLINEKVSTYVNSATTDVFFKKTLVDMMKVELLPDFGIPKNSILAVNSDKCGKGWNKFDLAKGKFIFGANSDYALRDAGIQDSITITNAHLPIHDHRLNAVTRAEVDDGQGYAKGGEFPSTMISLDADNPLLKGRNSTTRSLNTTEGGQPINIMPPYLALYFCKKD